MRDTPSPMVGAMLALALGAGCHASATIENSVLEDNQETLTSGYVVTHEFDDNTLTLAHVAGAPIVKGPVAGGAPIRFALEGQSCELVPGQPFTYEDSNERRSNPRVNRPGGPRIDRYTFTRIPFSLRCTDGPMPGSIASLRGANPRKALALAVPAFALAMLAGSFARSDRKGGENWGTASLILLAGFAAAIGLGIAMFDRGFALTLTLFNVGAALAGFIGARMFQRRKPHASIAWLAGAVIGPLPVALMSPAWTTSGPLAALACMAGGAIIASVAAVMWKPLV